MLSLSVNASCLTPPNDASKLVPPALSVRTKFLLPPSTKPFAVLLIVLATIPPAKLSGDGFEVGLLVPVESLSVLPEEPETSIGYEPLNLSSGTVPENKLEALV